MSRGLGDVYKRQHYVAPLVIQHGQVAIGLYALCLLYTSDAADDSLRVDLGGRRIIKKKFFQAEDGILD